MRQGTCYHGGIGAQNKGNPLALKAGGKTGLLFQLDSHGSGNAIQFPDVSSHILPLAGLRPLALLIGKPLCGLPMGYVWAKLEYEVEDTG